MAKCIELKPKTMSLKGAYKAMARNRVNEQIRQMREETNNQFQTFIESNNVRISKREIFNLLYRYQEYERLGNYTVITTNARNRIEQFCERSNWYTYGHRIVKCERANNTLFKLAVDIPFEEVEMMFSNDLRNRLNIIDKICR